MAKADAFFVDCGLTYDGSAATTISGLGHLEGEEVQVLGDGAYLGIYTVSGGSITLTVSVEKAQVGLAYTSTLKPTKLDISGLGIMTTKKITKAIISFYNTLGGQFGPNTSDMDNITFRDAGDALDASPGLFSGIKELSFHGGYERDGDIIVQQTQPLPMTVRGISMDTGVYAD